MTINTTPWHPVSDGRTHINAYSRSPSPIGRQLSNFAHSPFRCEDGSFASIEGYWYWLGVHEAVPGRERLRELVGWQAKQHGRDLKRIAERVEPRFREAVSAALDAKFTQHAPSRDALLQSNPLPIVHYYVKEGRPVPVVENTWVWEHMMQIRERLLSGGGT